VVRVTGEIDIANARLLILDAVIDALRVSSRVVVDLHEVTFMDASGVGALVRARDAVRRAGGELVLRSPSALTQRLLELTGLTTAFDVDPSQADCRDALGGAGVVPRAPRQRTPGDRYIPGQFLG